MSYGNLNIFTDEQPGPLSKIPWENTRRYLTYIVEKCWIQAENVHFIHNLACGAAEESEALETLFPHAQIRAIDTNAASIAWAQDTCKKCTRTTFLQDDLYEARTWKKLPKAQIVLLQQPQLSWSQGRMYITGWIREISKALSPDGIFIICFMCPADVEWFFDILDDVNIETNKYFDRLLREENPYGTLGDYYYIMAFRKKTRQKHAATRTQEKVTKILK